MYLSDILSPLRVRVEPRAGVDKRSALAAVADLLATRADGKRDDATAILRALTERESLQSTGIGEGVAIPHGALAELELQVAALLIAPEGIEFDAIDGERVTILFAVIGPRRASGEHLKVLARVSRLLRSDVLRSRLLAAPSGQAAFDIVHAEEGR